MTITNEDGIAASFGAGAGADRRGHGAGGHRWRHGWRRRAPTDLPAAPVIPSLDDLRPGQTCRVVTLHGGGAVRRRLLDMGIVPGAEVEVVRNAPLRDPIEIRVGNSFIVLRRGEAARIEVSRRPADAD
jgi:ferrous iron transport protein A